MKTGVECEYFLITPDGDDIADSHDTQAKPCYDQHALMRRYDVISEICDAMIKLGWGPYQNDHEDANGQFEMNWDYDDALLTADRHVFFKFMVKSIAEKHGLRATFMPKPFSHLTGNGCHAHVSLWDKPGQEKPVRNEPQGCELGLSKLAYHVPRRHHAHRRRAVRDLQPDGQQLQAHQRAAHASGATWSPNAVTYAGNNRTHMIRMPDAGRFELRLMDGAANPYLLQAGVLLRRARRHRQQARSGQPTHINMYDEGHRAKSAQQLPLNLLDAIRQFDKNKVIREGFGDELVDAYVKLKMQAWDSYTTHLSSWERENTLDC